MVARSPPSASLNISAILRAAADGLEGPAMGERRVFFEGELGIGLVGRGAVFREGLRGAVIAFCFPADRD